MQRFCERIIRYSKDLMADQFEGDDLVNDAVLRNLELLGEAAKQIPDSVRQRHPQVPWRRVAGLRDVLSLAYGVTPIQSRALDQNPRPQTCWPGKDSVIGIVKVFATMADHNLIQLIVPAEMDAESAVF